MEKIIKLLKNVLYILLLCISLHWGYSAVKFLVAEGHGLFGLSFIIVILLGFLFRKTTFIRNMYTYINSNKLIVTIMMACFQLMILFSSSLMIRSDASVVFNAASGAIDPASAQNYFTENANNLPLFLYEYSFFKVFGDHALWVMQLLNIAYVHVALWISFYTVKKHFSLEVADIYFWLFTLIIGFSPQFLAMYTDVMSLPIIALIIYIMLSIISKDKITTRTIHSIILVSMLMGIGYFIRPTLVILLIAFLLTIMLYRNFKSLLATLILVVLGFTLSYFPLNGIIHNQTIITPEFNKSKNMLTFIDLGLTFNGSDQIDFQNGLAQFVDENGEPWKYSREVVIKDIKRRVDNYTLPTFIEHSLYKQSLTTRDGTLGWNYDDTHPGVINPIFDRLSNYKILSLFRRYFIYINYDDYIYYKTFLQVVWIIIIIGLLTAYCFIIKNNNQLLFFLSLSIFGGMLFLQIFEGGKTRYLIQFLPQILIISAIGLHKLKNSSSHER